ncbi:Hypothetical predicted protein [Mytilus galloprovincialis]|uniref:Ubiquitin-like protease family profile domain-containing protein n=1 Tax=Mytilus galloprovincialis TaxID=29158 RepID=A0A8B6BHB2_MYTGA|nr:Hypothetical predicted protein [Mytilus galloprovincialis]
MGAISFAAFLSISDEMFPGHVALCWYRIEQMWGVIGRRVPDYKIVVLHIGANNLWNDTPADVLTHYQSLVDSIRRVNPSCQILLSGLLPRGQDMFPVNTPKTPSQVHSTQKSPQKSALKTKSKTPHSKKKLHFNLETVSEEEIDTCPISPDEKKDNIITLDDTPPGKKRKLDFPSPPISIEIEQEKKQPWIGTLTQVDKKTISDSKCLTSDIVNYAQNILSKQFPLIQGFQNTCYAPVFCNQQKKWLSETSFTPTQAPAVQIHHTGHSHWVTSLTKQSNEVYLLDSMYDTLTTSSEIQLSQIYSHGKKRLLVKLPEVQKQTNSIDCGLFAIANAVEFCFTSFSGGIHVEFDTELLREHLVICLEKGEFIPFPKKKLA